MQTSKTSQVALTLTTFATIGVTSVAPAIAQEFRSINGLGNNIDNPEFGEAETELIRILPTDYEDGFNSIRETGSTGNPLPNVRSISNSVSDQTEFVPNFLNASDWIWQWGQFIDHDLDINEGSPILSPAEDILLPDIDPITFPDDDPSDPGRVLPFIRVPAAEGTGTDPSNPRQQINEITSFIDASQVYGSEDERVSLKRTCLDECFLGNPGDGRLISSFDPFGTDGAFFDGGSDPLISTNEELLPLNRSDSPNANAVGLPTEELFIAGDIRPNEQIGLTAVHTLFLREHNRLAIEIAEQNPELNGDEIFDRARELVAVQMQVITYNEFLPILLGTTLLEDYDGYDPTVDPGVSNEFANGAFRVGHTLLSPELQLADPETGENIGSVALQDAFFNPAFVAENGVDSILLGLTTQVAQEVDTQVVDDVRNFLFEAPTGGVDLVSTNLKRGREVGIPGYNDARRELGLDPVTSFLTTDTELGITSDAETAARFASVYESVEDVDLWIGGIGEDAFNGGLVGELFHTIIADQFLRSRDGDRFFYLNDDSGLFINSPDIDIDGLFPETGLFDTRLSDVIIRNSSINADLVPDNVFIVSQTPVEQVPEPTGILSLLAMAGLGSGSHLWRKRQNGGKQA